MERDKLLISTRRILSTTHNVFHVPRPAFEIIYTPDNTSTTVAIGLYFTQHNFSYCKLLTRSIIVPNVMALEGKSISTKKITSTLRKKRKI